MGKHLSASPLLRPDSGSLTLPSMLHSEPGPPVLLQATALACFVFPANMILGPFGAAGYVAHILALLVMLLWLASVALGLHHTLKFEHPGRIAIAALVIVSCMTYAAMYAGISGPSTVTTRAAADRWMLLMAASFGIVLMTAETIRTIDSAMILVRVILRGAVFCSIVAVIQFATHVDPMVWIQNMMLGFTNNGGNQPFQERGSFLRVAGSTFHPIELGVIASMLVPLSLWRAMYDGKGQKWMHWAGTCLLIFAIAATVSRSGMVGIATAALVYIPFMPARARQWAVLGFVGAAVALFLAVPGLMATLFGTATAGTADTSITARLQDFPRVEAMVSARPWTGIGPGAYLAPNAIEVLDNQYLKTMVEMGIPGFVALLAYMVVPGAAAWVAALYAKDERLKVFSGALAAACLVAAPSTAAFDSLGFPVVALLYPFCVGLSGAAWLMVAQERRVGESRKQRHNIAVGISERQA